MNDKRWGRHKESARERERTRERAKTKRRISKHLSNLSNAQTKPPSLPGPIVSA